MIDRVIDAVFGAQTYSECVLEEQAIEIPLPERSYRALARRVDGTWQRERFLRQRKTYVKIAMFPGEELPIRDDFVRVYEDGGSKTIHEAVRHLVHQVLQRR